MEPLLSICVPSYNVSAYLEKGLSSYCSPELAGKLEVIVVNDGSTDDGATLAIAKRFQEADPATFTIIDKPNGGHGSTINAALAQARGLYFRVIDADDWAATSELVRLVELLENETCDVVVDLKTEVDMASGDETEFELSADLARFGERRSFEEVCALEELVPSLMIHTLVFRTEYLRNCGMKLLEKTFYEDYEYVVKGTLDATDIRFVPLKVYHYLVGNASQSVADASYVRRYEDHRRVVDCICQLYEDRRADLSEARKGYLFRRAQLICNTHYNICLIFDEDRSRGMRRAKAFRAYLQREHPELAAATERRYHLARVLHMLGVHSQAQLDRIGRFGQRS